MSDDLTPDQDPLIIDVPDIPMMPEDTGPEGIQDDFNYDVANKFAFIGVGQAGGKIAEAFYSAGYRKVAAVNTAQQDIQDLKMPEDNKLVIEGGGAGKDPSVAVAKFSGMDEEIFDLFKKSFGDDVDRIFVTLGTGGGTGSGAGPKVVEVARRFLTDHGKEATVGVVAALPKTNEGQKAAQNTIYSLRNLTALKPNPLIVIDNQKIQDAFKLSVAKLYPTTNSLAASLLHTFNRLAKCSTPYSSFDEADFAKVLDSGVLAYGATTIPSWKSESDITTAIRQRVGGSVLCDVDLSTAKSAALLFVASPEILDEIPASHFDHAREMLTRIMGGDLIFEGVYPGSSNDLRAYVAFGGISLPKARLEGMADLASISRDKVAKFLKV